MNNSFEEPEEKAIDGLKAIIDAERPYLNKALGVGQIVLGVGEMYLAYKNIPGILPTIVLFTGEINASIGLLRVIDKMEEDKGILENNLHTVETYLLEKIIHAPKYVIEKYSDAKDKWRSLFNYMGGTR